MGGGKGMKEYTVHYLSFISRNPWGTTMIGTFCGETHPDNNPNHGFLKCSSIPKCVTCEKCLKLMKEI